MRRACSFAECEMLTQMNKVTAAAKMLMMPSHPCEGLLRPRGSLLAIRKARRMKLGRQVASLSHDPLRAYT
jgi:hypothetical protein